jgi:hypothetical protein
MIVYLDACWAPVKAAGCSLIEVISQRSTASTPVSCGSTLYLPRPMNSVRTFSVSTCSAWYSGVSLAKVGIPIVRIVSGRNEPRPARV